jgi:hypothetical protein
MHIILYIGAALSVFSGIGIIYFFVTSSADEIDAINFPSDPISLAIGTFFLAAAFASVATFIKNRLPSD